MGFKDQSIKRKTMAVIMLTTVAVLLLTAAAFTGYDLLTYRQSLVHSLSATAAILADHSTAALALRDEKTPRQPWPPCAPTRALWYGRFTTAKAASSPAIPPRRP
jgi:hypothetical protein